MSKRQKVGIMGGTFNPIHIGHLILAENAYEKFALNKVLIMPSGIPPHKDRQLVVLKNHRVEMVRLAIENNPHFELSLIEINRDGTTFTFETLKQLTKENPNTDYYFILGADSLFSFEKWKNPDLICKYSTIIVAPRIHSISGELNKQVAYLKEKYQAKIEYLDTPNMDISSEIIRKKISMNKSIKYYIPDKVEQYIYQNQLYNFDGET